MQLGCNKASPRLLWALKQAIGAVNCQTVTSETSSVTAEVAGSSPVVPAILSKRVIGRDTGNSYPQSHPQLLLNAPRFESYGVQKFFLSRTDT